tara:strand:- start:1264 stop:2031 length:768 start_codon:yes stop_codon:yes gene_type:complete
MSQYLSRFYCGNKEGLCNFTEPMNYEKVIDRQFDNLLTDMVQQCSGEGKEKGYCCDNIPKNKKPMTTNDLKNINRIAKGKIFNKDENMDFLPNQIPLVKTNKKNGKIESIDICQCGGAVDEYDRCVEKNCRNYKVPTRYEYCKLGDMSNQYGCYGDNQKDCKVDTLNPNEGYTYSPKLKINNLLPDCYLNICNKRMIDGNLDQTANFTKDVQYYMYDNSTLCKNFDSISNYLLLDRKKKTPKLEIDLSIKSILNK